MKVRWNYSIQEILQKSEQFAFANPFASLSQHYREACCSCPHHFIQYPHAILSHPFPIAMWPLCFHLKRIQMELCTSCSGL